MTCGIVVVLSTTNASTEKPRSIFQVRSGCWRPSSSCKALLITVRTGVRRTSHTVREGWDQNDERLLLSELAGLFGERFWQIVKIWDSFWSEITGTETKQRFQTSGLWVTFSPWTISFWTETTVARLLFLLYTVNTHSNILWEKVLV